MKRTNYPHLTQRLMVLLMLAAMSLMSAAVLAVDADGDGFDSVESGGLDCDDTDNTIYPGAPEIVGDGIDQDCNGYDSCYYDGDKDGYGVNILVDNLDGICDASQNESMVNTDCDDTNPNINPGAAEIPCTGVDEDCNGATGDDQNNDGDPVSYCNGDCDDNDPTRYPGVLRCRVRTRWQSRR